MNWRKPRRSVANGACVEVGDGTATLVRDSKLGEASPVLKFSTDAWQTFIKGVKQA